MNNYLTRGEKTNFGMASHQTSMMSNNNVMSPPIPTNLDSLKMKFLSAVHPLIIRSKFGDREFEKRSVILQHK